MTKKFKLRKLEVDRVDLVDVGANQFAEIVIAKAAEEDPKAKLKAMMAAKFGGGDEEESESEDSPDEEMSESKPMPGKPGGGGEGLAPDAADAKPMPKVKAKTPAVNDLKNGTKPFTGRPKPTPSKGRKPLPPKGEKIAPPAPEDEEDKQKNPFGKSLHDRLPGETEEEYKARMKKMKRRHGKAAPILEHGDEPLMKHGSHDQSSHGNWSRGGGITGPGKAEDVDNPENIKRFLDMVREMNREAGSDFNLKEALANRPPAFSRKPPAGYGGRYPDPFGKPSIMNQDPSFNNAGIPNDADIEMIDAANASDAAARTRRTNTNTFDPAKHGPALRGAIDSALRYGNPLYESITVVADDYGIPQDDRLMGWVFDESQKMKREMDRGFNNADATAPVKTPRQKWEEEHGEDLDEFWERRRKKLRESAERHMFPDMGFGSRR